MNMLEKAIHMLRVLTGLADVSGSQLTPSHGWLLPATAAARQRRTESERRRATIAERNPRA